MYSISLDENHGTTLTELLILSSKLEPQGHVVYIAAPISNFHKENFNKLPCMFSSCSSIWSCPCI
jgi:hypothetical protein